VALILSALPAGAQVSNVTFAVDYEVTSQVNGTGGDQNRGIAHGDGEVYISNTDGTAGDTIFVIDEATGAFLHTLSQEADDTFDVDANAGTTTFNYAGFLGPYGIATVDDGSVYFGGWYGGASLNRLTTTASGDNPVAVAVKANNHRTMDATGSGTGTLLYHYTTTGAAGEIVIYSTADGNTFTVLETTSTGTTIEGAHVIAAGSANTGADGDVLYVANLGNSLLRWNRTGGSWVVDGTFAGPTNMLGADVVNIGGVDHVVAIRSTGSSPAPNELVLLDGTTGAQIGSSFIPVAARTGIGALADVSVRPNPNNGGRSGDIYALFEDHRVFAKVCYSTFNVDGDLSDLGTPVAVDTNHPDISSFSGAAGQQFAQALFLNEDKDNIYIGVQGDSSFGNPFVVFIDVGSQTGVGSTVPATGGGGGALNGGDMVGTVLDLADIDYGLSGNSNDDLTGTDPSGFFLDGVEYVGGANTATYLGNHMHTENTTTTNSTIAGTTGGDSAWTTAAGTGDTVFAYSDNDFATTASQGFEISVPKAVLGVGNGDTISLFAAFTGGSGFFSSDVLPEITGAANTNIGSNPDFTGQAGTQATAATVVPVELSAFDVE
jgi:hypothetical protein